MTVHGVADVFDRFAQNGILDSRTCVKLLKECKIIDKKYTTTDCDLAYTKHKKKGNRGLTIDEFEPFVAEIAIKKKCDPSDIMGIIAGKEQLSYHGTQAEAVRFHDDKSTYTGVHKRGGPTTNDNASTPGARATDSGKVITLDQMCDRSPANARGVNVNFSAPRGQQ